jgi:hypothetical protein
MYYDLHGDVNSVIQAYTADLIRTYQVSTWSCWLQIRALGHNFTGVVYMITIMVHVLERKNLPNVYKLIQIT